MGEPSPLKAEASDMELAPTQARVLDCETLSQSKMKRPPERRAGVNDRSLSSDLLAGFGTFCAFCAQVAGLHRAGPSATLDKAMQFSDTNTLYHGAKVCQ